MIVEEERDGTDTDDVSKWFFFLNLPARFTKDLLMKNVGIWKYALTVESLQELLTKRRSQ